MDHAHARGGGHDEADDPNLPREPLPHGERMIGLFVALVLLGQLTLPDAVTPGPVWLIPAIEIMSALWLVVQTRLNRTPDDVRASAIGVALVLVLATVANALQLLRTLFEPTKESGGELLIAGIQVLAINVLSFAVIYWRLDGGGPSDRARGRVTNPDFQFPQQAAGPTNWRPAPLDYLFTAYTNIVAFSPTDTMPLRHRVKMLFLLQSSVSLLTIVVTLSRAINLIPNK